MTTSNTPAPRQLYQLTFGSALTGYHEPSGEPVYEEVWHLHGHPTDDFIDGGPAPYGHVDGRNIPSIAVDAAMSWAEAFISAATDYRVVGWDHLVPRLVETRYTLVFELSNGGSKTIEVGATGAAMVVTAFDSPDRYEQGSRNTVVHQLPDQGDQVVRTMRINLDHVVVIHQSSRDVRVTRQV